MERAFSWFLVAVSLLSVAILAFTMTTARAYNNNPIVLVYAWFAWGRGQMPGFNIWGGNMCDIQEELIEDGYQTFTVSMGPFPSTWGRECELYAQIRGGTVDYGKAHSCKYHHARYSRTYNAFYPEWGQLDPSTGTMRKVHLIGHCFGGLTSRLIIQLLEKGSSKEQAVTPVPQLSPLFAGNHSWVLSCTTLCTPHYGTSVLDQTLLKNIAGKDTLRYIMMMTMPVLNKDAIYDLQMDQWGFRQEETETLEQAMGRLSASDFWKNNKDFSNYDIVPCGIYEFNSRVKAQPCVYHFSLATDATYKDASGKYHAMASMLPLFYPFSSYIQSYTRTTPPFPVDKTWFPNDGTVNVVSMNRPKVCSDTPDTIVDFNGAPRAGKWNFLGTIKGLDHLDIVEMNFGWFPIYNPKNWFLNHAGLLSSLPQ